MTIAALAVEEIRSAGALQALSHPIRVWILDVLREPLSAAGVARRIGHPRQKVNYHLKELERAGLVERVGEQRAGNFIETLYRAVARTFVVSPQVTWGSPQRAKAMAEQLSLQTLVALGERLQRDAAVLLDRAAFDGEEIASASVVGEVRFASADDRAAFMREYLAVIGPLFKKYASREGNPHVVLITVYPHPDPGTEEAREWKV